ncbi:hydroxymethylglutaryl-CoA synthase [Flexilinea flocculi]|uniref:Hydroxymethylglutaryl-CoA synthase, putative n=1 Tax=Flexilinea flocculi TaxID=1678840 RepID=A0A0S7BIH4_9CHLR|nr:hydroxymethylglutaryl-CoA synthase [Flexilinea flocculi]GAP40172.1 hydroxymethylglutaryl-CoA synthase, putative [Flexilinea flocculi]
MKLLIPEKPVGIIGYGAYIPRYRIPASEISRIWHGDSDGMPIKEKSVPGLDEDTITMSIEAARNAINRAQIDPKELRAVWIGSESHPYAVKPSGTVVAEAIGASESISAADFEFACKAGTEAVIAGMGFVGSGMGDYVLAVGMDTAQGRPGDVLEYTAAAGGAAVIIGPASNALAVIDAAYSFVTDTPDFWRRQTQKYPEHGQRFTGEPAYFHHLESSIETFFAETGTAAKDYRFAVFHQPNAKFPQKLGKEFGFTKEQFQTGLLSPMIGNTYSGAVLLGLSAILDIAEPGDKIFAAAFGSGAGSDTFSFTVTDQIRLRRSLAPSTQAYINRRTEIDYAVYARHRGKYVMN